MNKSSRRLTVEKEIDDAHRNSLNVATQMVQEEFDGNLESALSDESFIKRMQDRVSSFYDMYVRGYKRLEIIEEEEGHPALHEYAAQLDEIAEKLPNKKFGHYPFSGIDFYWARIFEKIAFEDIAFDQENPILKWWSPEMYSEEGRKRIVSLLQQQNIISLESQLEFLPQDAEVSNDHNQFNNSTSTLILKSHGQGYLEQRFKNESMKYSAVIVANSQDFIKDIEQILQKKEGYRKDTYINGERFHTPFSMGLNHIHIFIK